MAQEQRHTAEIFEGETLIPDDYPVYGDYLYVVDGRVVRSDVFGTVRDLKCDQIFIGNSASEVRKCNIEARRACAALKLAEGKPSGEDTTTTQEGR